MLLLDFLQMFCCFEHKGRNGGRRILFWLSWASFGIVLRCFDVVKERDNDRNILFGFLWLPSGCLTFLMRSSTAE